MEDNSLWIEHLDKRLDDIDKRLDDIQDQIESQYKIIELEIRSFRYKGSLGSF
jgi:hypothetical protein